MAHKHFVPIFLDDLQWSLLLYKKRVDTYRLGIQQLRYICKKSKQFWLFHQILAKIKDTRIAGVGVQIPTVKLKKFVSDVILNQFLLKQSMVISMHDKRT